MLQRVAEEALRFQSQQSPDERISQTGLREAESILHTFAGGNRDAEAIATLELDSDSEESVQSDYKSSNDTSNDREDDASDGSSTPEPTEELPLVSRDQQSPNKTKCTPTPTTEEVKGHIPTPPKEAEDRIPTPPAEEAKDRIPTPPAEEAKDHTPLS